METKKVAMRNRMTPKSTPRDDEPEEADELDELDELYEFLGRL
jgi:hypothetical protein